MLLSFWPKYQPISEPETPHVITSFQSSRFIIHDKKQLDGLLNSRHLYTRFLIGQSQSYDFSSANQEQGGKWICRQHMVIYARWLEALMRAVSNLAAYVDDNKG